MNIKGRIHARKILLVYRYEQYFLENAGEKEILMEEIEKIQHVVKQEEGIDEVILKEVMTRDYYSDFDTEIAYIITNYFRKFEEDIIDYDYLKLLGPKFYDYRDQVRDLVNEHTVSFGYDDMDLIDRVIFVLGYVEFLELKTPKEVVINEMVELAKRYGDDKSSKLINGIGHKVLSAVTDDVSKE
jgi:N utilization substance protein B